MSGKSASFDAVIGNPPYQKTAGSGSAFWQHFVNRGFGLLREGGRIAMIHPPRWRGAGGLSGAAMEEARRNLRESDMEWISMTRKEDCGKVFRGIATPFDAYVARKSRSPHFVTEIECTDGRTVMDRIKGMVFVPNFQCPDLDRIIAKDGEERVDVRHSSAMFCAARDWMRDGREGGHVHPCVWSVSRREESRTARGGGLTLHWSSTRTPPPAAGRPAHFGVPKAIFGIWNQSGIPHADLEGEYGLTQHAAGIADDPEVLPLIAMAMDGHRFRRAMDAARFNTEDWNLPVIGLLRKDFWKEFIARGVLVDRAGTPIDRLGNPLEGAA